MEAITMIEKNTKQKLLHERNIKIMTNEERIRYRRAHHITKELLSHLEDLAKQEDDYEKSIIIERHIKRVASSLDLLIQDVNKLLR